jgi:hypothetical protein
MRGSSLAYVMIVLSLVGFLAATLERKHSLRFDLLLVLHIYLGLQSELYKISQKLH